MGKVFKFFGCLFVFVIVIAVTAVIVAYFLTKSRSVEENRRLYFSEYTDDWMKKAIEIACPEATIQEYPTRTGYSSIPSDVQRQIKDVERRLENGEITIEAAESQIKQLAAPFIGEKTVNNIFNVVNNPNISSKEAAREIIRDVPTGLSKEQDNFVKDVVNKIIDRSDIGEQ